MSGVIPQEEVSDRELVTRLQAGDERAFNDLVRRHQQRAYNVAYQLLRDHEDATEVAQDALVRVYRGIERFRGDCAFTTWLHGIVVNLARNKHRWWKRRGRQATVSLDAPRSTLEGDQPREQAADTDGPDTATVQAELVEQIGRAMDRLPRKFREVLVLRNVEEMRYEEIAVALRCSVGTVKSRIARAREALREKITLGE
ncbi:sigma-70 family RNA polymerase sigma factor [bacterium]|nr:sigma-70 family RNA polymerase sigma factor [bacterium]